MKNKTKYVQQIGIALRELIKPEELLKSLNVDKTPDEILQEHEQFKEDLEDKEYTLEEITEERNKLNQAYVDLSEACNLFLEYIDTVDTTENPAAEAVSDLKAEFIKLINHAELYI